MASLLILRQPLMLFCGLPQGKEEVCQFGQYGTSGAFLPGQALFQAGYNLARLPGMGRKVLGDASGNGCVDNLVEIEDSRGRRQILLTAGLGTTAQDKNKCRAHGYFGTDGFHGALHLY
jgi:hypothetical protein